MKPMTFCAIIAFTAVLASSGQGRPAPQPSAREQLLMDFGWRFALGHAVDAKKDFDHGTGYFSHFAKCGFGDGAAAKNFNDSAWRMLDLPHDWCVELPFDRRGGYSHGFKAIGRNFPENSVGWYRKHFFIPASDLGKRLRVGFDGVFRNSTVWVNGFYCGSEHSGYSGFSYDISEYLNYGGENVVAVRVDATTEEGWFYEGAGIYRHVWLTATSPLHVLADGTFVTTELKQNTAVLTVRTVVINEAPTASVFTIEESIVDEQGGTVAAAIWKDLALGAGEQREFRSILSVSHPHLWSIESPYRHRLHTVIRKGRTVLDTDDTMFGIRTVRFDANEGFFLNGHHVKLLGTNMHQDHAGVGIALPDALQEFRIRKLKEMGSNAIRTAHNPPTPELLDACDRLGMLVMDENRLMGTNDEHRMNVERFMKRDRNHPSVVLWSLGNEEWTIEGNVLGARIGAAMQSFAHRFDSSRAFTVGLSGGWDTGTGTVMEVIGYNYIVQGDIDEHHKKFAWQAGVGTEESNTVGTRGIYRTDTLRAHLAATNRMPENVGTESGWKFYAARPFLSGLFFWTGFDYRGEMHPFDWPAISSQFGLLDVCGFPKDISYYLKSWWCSSPVLHIVPNWNSPVQTGNAAGADIAGINGQGKIVTVYSNCDDVELFLNGKSFGKKSMPRNGHLEWTLPYAPGVVSAKGYTGQTIVLEDSVAPAGPSELLRLVPDRDSIDANGMDVSVVTVQVTDAHGIAARNDGSEVSFSLDGPGKIIGVGNGDPSSHEPDRYFDRGSASQWKRNVFNGLAQVLVQSTKQPGVVTLKATAIGMKQAAVMIHSRRHIIH